MPRGKVVPVGEFVRKVVQYLGRKSKDAQEIIMDNIQRDLGAQRPGVKKSHHKQVQKDTSTLGTPVATQTARVPQPAKASRKRKSPSKRKAGGKDKARGGKASPVKNSKPTPKTGGGTTRGRTTERKRRQAPPKQNSGAEAGQEFDTPQD